MTILKPHDTKYELADGTVHEPGQAVRFHLSASTRSALNRIKNRRLFEYAIRKILLSYPGGAAPGGRRRSSTHHRLRMDFERTWGARGLAGAWGDSEEGETGNYGDSDEGGGES